MCWEDNLNDAWSCSDQNLHDFFEQACESVNKLMKESVLELHLPIWLPRSLACPAVHEDFVNIKTVRG